MIIEQHETSYPIDVDLGDNGGPVKLRDPEEVKSWASKEKEFWEWIEKADTHGRQDLNQVRDNQKSTYNHLLSLAAQWAEGQEPALNGIMQQLREYKQKKLALHSSAPDAGFVETIRKEVGDTEALAGIGVATRQIHQFNDQIVLQGAVLFTVLKAGLSSKTASAQRRALTRLQKEMQERHANDTQDVDDFKAELSQLVKAQAKIRGQGQHLMAQAIRQMRNHAQKEWGKLKETYDRALSLEAPVTYWRRKRKKHKYLAWTFGFILAAYVAFVAWSGWKLLHAYGPISLSELSGLGLPHVALAMLATGVLLALARIFYRLFLSQLHLYNDADERVTMVETYLALHRKGHAEKEWLEVLYGRLFAAASDGVVRDDIGPVTTLDVVKTVGEKFK